jgi:hypothetical protein
MKLLSIVGMGQCDTTHAAMEVNRVRIANAFCQPGLFQRLAIMGMGLEDL